MREAVVRRVRRGQANSRVVPFPVPTGGWDASGPISNMKPDRAIVLDNWFPGTGYVSVRKGFQVHAAGMGNGVVESILEYEGKTAATSKLFAATGGKVFDVTARGNGIEAVNGLGSNRWQSINFSTAGGHFIWICNGIDAPRHFNGAAWAAPALVIAGHTADEIINVNAHKKRIWIIFKDSTDAGYLPTGAVAGNVTVFPLGSVFTKGGHLVAMATWTRDGGAGEDDFAVFVSSKGQVAVYGGTDPASDATWALVGVYDVGSPIGYRCFTKAGGDLALINIDGVLPMSKALAQDRGAAAAIAITARINNAMNLAARSYKANFGWEMCTYPKGTYVLLNVPLQEGVAQHQYVMNTLTGAWCRFTGQNANCWKVFQDDLYFGGNDGLVYRADQTGLDITTPIDAVGQTAYRHYGTRGLLTQWHALQAILTADSDVRPAVGISTDFKDNATLGVPSASPVDAALYDSAVYDLDVYAIEGRTVAEWASVSGDGYMASIHFRARTGIESGLTTWGNAQWGQDPWSRPLPGDVTMQLNGFNVLFEQGQPL